MSDNWVFYPANVEDQPATFLVNLGIPEQVDIQLYRWRIGVTFAYESDREDGFPSNETAARLNDAEDRFVAALLESLSAVNVGRLTRSRRRDVYLYAPSADGADAEVRKAAATVGLTVADVRIEEDEEWSGFFEFLCPGIAESQWISNQMLVNKLEDEGDCLTAVRSVDHCAIFSTPADRAAFAASITAQGFTLDDEHDHEPTGEDEVSDEYPYSLSFSREHAVDLDTANDVTIPLAELAAEHNGMYDGWATQIMKE